ncbi:MAG: PhzF family phenazine biosynthesis protein [Acidimicrobiia bacterium]|nr:MAG: PhzF family phenazine biosynthesis protein [Acidimicrobiia bacterium]
MSRPCHVLRVFTRGDLGGNHLGVINDVVGVSDGQKQAIATDLGFSETIFVDWTDPARDPVVRIFTPVDELPFAGHPLVGAAWVLAILGPKRATRLRTNVGTFTCAVDGDGATVTASIPIFEADNDVARVAADAGMPEPVRSLRLALPKHYLCARYDTFDDVAALDPDMDALMGVFGFAAFARDGNQVKLRFFAPGAGVPEDPATGSAAVALAKAFSIWGEPEGQVTINQGDEIDHPSTIQLSWTPEAVTIGGSVRHDEVVLVS